MKKYRLFAAALALLLLCACGLSGEERWERALDELNRESELPFALTQPEAEAAKQKKSGCRCQFCGAIFEDRPDVCGTCRAAGAFEYIEYVE